MIGVMSYSSSPDPGRRRPRRIARRTALCSLLFVSASLAVASGCRKEAASNAEEFADLEAKQTRCPVDGKPIDREISVNYASRQIFFCGPPCRQKFNTDNRSYLEKLPQFGGQE